MAKPAEVIIGPFENVDGTKIAYPISLRNVNFWVSWSVNPGDAFDVSDIEFDPANRLQPAGITFIKRIDNRFLFNMRMRGLERYASLTVPENIFGGNAETRLRFPVLSYAPIVQQISVPSTTVTTRTTQGVMLRDPRGRDTYWQRDGFSLEGVVNGNFYSSREAIEDLNLPGVNTNPNSFRFGERFTSGGQGNDFSPTIRLPDKSKGTVRVRVDKLAHFTIAGAFDGRHTEAFSGRGPGADFTTDYFEFDTTASTVISLNRGAEDSNAISHAENSEMLFIDQILDVSDTRWVVKPINELQWKSDEQLLYNQIRVLYGNGDEHFTENPQSVFDNGGREFTMRTPLANHQTQWVRWIAQNLLDSFSELQYTASLELKLSLHLKIGQTILLRGLQQDNINNIVQVVGVEHNFARQMTNLTVRTVRRATPQSFTAPAFATNVFTSGTTVNIVSRSIYIAQLVAFGNPTPRITVSGNPSWMTVDDRGNIRATPTAIGSHTVTFTASNGVMPDATFTLTFNVVVPNQWNSGVWNTFYWG